MRFVISLWSCPLSHQLRPGNMIPHHHRRLFKLSPIKVLTTWWLTNLHMFFFVHHGHRICSNLQGVSPCYLSNLFFLPAMFVDIDENVSVLDRIKLTFVYDEVNDDADDEFGTVSYCIVPSL